MANTENTTNNAFPVPTGVNDGTDLAVGLYEFGEAVDGMWSRGTLAGRPGAGTVNRLYYATDQGLWYLDTGSAWKSLELQSNKGAANGYASLDSGSKVPVAQLGNILTCAVSNPTRAVSTVYQPNTTRPTMVNVQIVNQPPNDGNGQAVIGATSSPSTTVSRCQVTETDGGSTNQTLSFIVPPAWYYEIICFQATILVSATAVTEWTL